MVTDLPSGLAGGRNGPSSAPRPREAADTEGHFMRWSLTRLQPPLLTFSKCLQAGVTASTWECKGPSTALGNATQYTATGAGTLAGDRKAGRAIVLESTKAGIGDRQPWALCGPSAKSEPCPQVGACHPDPSRPGQPCPLTKALSQPTPRDFSQLCSRPSPHCTFSPPWAPGPRP